MEINRQLFEDVLSGRLKGTFVLRDGRRFNSIYCCRNLNDYHTSHPYRLHYNNYSYSYKPNGLYLISDEKIELDIVDFIPNMKENELTIEIPDNKVVDWDESKKQNKIVLKDKQLTYRDICKKLFENISYYTTASGKICSFGIPTERITDPNNATTEHQLECILAKNQLANAAVYLNSLSDETTAKYYIYNGFNLNVQQLVEPKCNLGLVMFKSAKLAQQAIEILGEETVKLALEPLGI